MKYETDWSNSSQCDRYAGRKIEMPPSESTWASWESFFGFPGGAYVPAARPKMLPMTSFVIKYFVDQPFCLCLLQAFVFFCFFVSTDHRNSDQRGSIQHPAPSATTKCPHFDKVSTKFPHFDKVSTKFPQFDKVSKKFTHYDTVSKSFHKVSLINV